MKKENAKVILQTEYFFTNFINFWKITIIKITLIKITYNIITFLCYIILLLYLYCEVIATLCFSRHTKRKIMYHWIAIHYYLLNLSLESVVNPWNRDHRLKELYHETFSPKRKLGHL